jgi:mannitol-1-phosphate 5-dehydrogenase
MGKLVQWGAGNIGRSFVGQIFAKNGWEVTFVDVDAKLIQVLSTAVPTGSSRSQVTSPKP